MFVVSDREEDIWPSGYRLMPFDVGLLCKTCRLGVADWFDCMVSFRGRYRASADRGSMVLAISFDRRHG